MKLLTLTVLSCLLLSLTAQATERASDEVATEQVEESSTINSKRMESKPIVPPEETEKDDKSKPSVMSEEAAAEMKAQMEAMKAKYEALDDVKKEQLYELYDEISEKKLALLGKYVEFELLSEKQADAIQKQLSSYATDVRNGRQFLNLSTLMPLPVQPVEPSADIETMKNKKHAEMMQELQKMQEKFNALSEEQKTELYTLYDEVNSTKLKLLNKYVEFELVTPDQAKVIEENMNEMAKNIRSGKHFMGLTNIKPMTHKH